MAKNKINKIFGAMALGAVILAVPGCTDTWDEHYDGSDSKTQATQSLWQIICSKPELSRFASLAQKTKYWKDEKHEIKDYSFQNVLSSGQINTLWVPTNDAFTQEEYEKWSEMCETNGYSVMQQLMSNHIALFRYNYSDSKIDTIKTINGKNQEFNKKDLTIQGVRVIEKNIPAVNGMLHVIDGIIPFHYNFYEQFKFGKETEKFTEFLLSRDTVYFYQYASIEGIPDKDGNPTYNDSVYVTSNKLFSRTWLPAFNSDAVDIAEKGVAFDISKEDSSIVMCVPSDQAWEEAVKKMKPYYKYPTKYVDMTKRTKKTLAASDYDRTVEDTAALSIFSLEQDLIAPAVFNLHEQPKKGGELWDEEKFVSELEKGTTADYLLNTRGDSLFNTGDSEGNSWMLTNLFNGKKVDMSNGVAYITDNWAFPAHYYKPDVEVDVNGRFFLTTSTDFYTAGNSSKLVSFNNATYSDLTERFGKVYNNNFYYFENSNGKAFQVEIPLEGNVSDAYVPNAQVRSGKYDIYAVIVPLFYKDIANKGMDSLFYASDEEIMEYVKKSNYYTRFQVLVRCNDIDKEVMWKAYHPSGTKSDASGNTFQVEGMDACKVTTVKLIEDFEFPTSYAGMRWTFPTLQIKSAGKNATKTAPGYSFDLCIDKIILKSKETGEEIAIKPEYLK